MTEEEIITIRKIDKRDIIEISDYSKYVELLEEELIFTRKLLLNVLDQAIFRDEQPTILDTKCISSYECACLYLEKIGILKNITNCTYSDNITPILRLFQVLDEQSFEYSKKELNLFRKMKRIELVKEKEKQ